MAPEHLRAEKNAWEKLKKTQINWEIFHDRSGRNHITKILILSKSVYKFNAISSKFSVHNFFEEIVKKVPNVYEKGRTRIAKINLKKEQSETMYIEFR